MSSAYSRADISCETGSDCVAASVIDPSELAIQRDDGVAPCRTAFGRHASVLPR